MPALEVRDTSTPHPPLLSCLCQHPLQGIIECHYSTCWYQRMLNRLVLSVASLPLLEYLHRIVQFCRWRRLAAWTVGHRRKYCHFARTFSLERQAMGSHGMLLHRPIRQHREKGLHRPSKHFRPTSDQHLSLSEQSFIIHLSAHSIPQFSNNPKKCVVVLALWDTAYFSGFENEYPDKKRKENNASL